MNKNPIDVAGIPDTTPDAEAALCRSRLILAATDLAERCSYESLDLRVTIGAHADEQQVGIASEPDQGQRQTMDEQTPQYSSSRPRFRFDQLIAPASVHDELMNAIEVIRLESTVFDEWGLREIEPFPKSALNFHGPPGTGKTLAAHGVAAQLGRNILVASYADIESKYHGDGPKNVKAIFIAAERDNAVLFIDEADSLLSKRLTNVTQGSEQAINSMRSQLLICLEQFRGVAIFATNLVENYDKAFETRVRHIQFTMPDAQAREQIWLNHFPQKLPVHDRAAVAHTLAHTVDDICGRDIRNAVIDTAIRVARRGSKEIMLQDLIDGISKVKASRIRQSDEPESLSAQDKASIEAQVAAALKPGASGPQIA